MGMFSSIAKMVAPMVLTAITGGAAAPLMAMAMKMVAMEVAKQLIQVIGEKLGLPQGIIDMCKMACASAAGMPDSARTSLGEGISNLAREANLSPTDSGRFQRDMQDAANSSTSNLGPQVDRFVSDAMKAIGKKVVAGGSAIDEGESWLVALAKALGAAMDEKAGQLKEKAASVSNLSKTKLEEVGKKTGGAADDVRSRNTEVQNRLSSESALLQAYGNEMQFISSAATNALKSVGEAQSTLARK